MSLRRMLLCTAFFMICLTAIAWWGGGDRLFGTQDASAEASDAGARLPTPEPPVAACLTASDHSRPAPGAPVPPHPRDPHRACEEGVTLGRMDALRCLCLRDTNGNVLQHACYRRAVYNAFSLEDAGG